MRRNIDNIEIKDPPIEELKKKSSCLKSSCFTGCGCIFIFVIASIFLLKYSGGPQTKELKAVPDNFPTSTIPVYDKDSIDKINFTPGNQISRIQEIAAFVPKLILSPILMIWENKTTNLRDTFNWQNFQNFMKKPAVDPRDTVVIEWKDLPADPRFIEKYYKNELTKNKFEILMINEDQYNYQFTFSKNDLEGTFLLVDDANKKGTDYFTVTLKIPKSS